MLNKKFLDKEGFEHRLEILRKLAKSIALEINEIVGESSNTAVSENEIEIDLDEQVRSFEIDLIRFALFKSSGKQNCAAKMLKIKPTTLNERIKRYGITLDKFRLASINHKKI